MIQFRVFSSQWQMALASDQYKKSKNTTSRRNNVDDVINWIRWGRQITTGRQAKKEVKKFKSFWKIEKLPSDLAEATPLKDEWGCVTVRSQLTFMTIPRIERLRICFNNTLDENIAFNGCQYQLNNGFDGWLNCYNERMRKLINLLWLTPSHSKIPA